MVAVEAVLAGAIAATVGFLLVARSGTIGPLHGFAISFVLFPVLEDLVGFVRVAPLITRPTTLEPYTVTQLVELPWRIARDTLGPPVVGLALVALFGGAVIAREHVAAIPSRWAPWRRQLGYGWALVPIVVGAEAVVLLLLQGPASFLKTGDESALFANAGIEHVILLSLVPAVVEELYYRGMLQSVIERFAPEWGRVWTAIGVQGVLFGVAHGGYANLAHLLGPLIFGLGMGYVRSTVGVGACVVAHAAVNLLYFSVDPGAGSVELQAVVAVLTLAGMVALWLSRRTFLARLRAGPRPAVGPAARGSG